MTLFLNTGSQVRSGWKFAAYVMFFLILYLAAAVIVTSILAPSAEELMDNQLVVLAMNQFALFIPAAGAMLLTVRFLDHRPLRTFGVGFMPNWRAHLLWGLGIAAVMLGVMLAGCYAFGYVAMRWTGGQAPPQILLATLGILMVAALNEELVFRGFPLQLLVEGIGQWPAVIAMSMLFGALHLFNPNASWLGVLNTVVAGVMLSLAYVRTRSLALPYGIHIGWNAGLGFVFGFPLSGIDLASLWTTGTAGSETVLGGGYGPEGGLLATFIFASAALMVDKYGSIHSTKAHSGGDLGRGHWNRAGDS
jgi:membrane protease YdiL (CAAX protease family)